MSCVVQHTLFRFRGDLHGFFRISVQGVTIWTRDCLKGLGNFHFWCLKTIKNSLLDTLSGQNWSVLSAGVRKTVVQIWARLWFQLFATLTYHHFGVKFCVCLDGPTTGIFSDFAYILHILDIPSRLFDCLVQGFWHVPSGVHILAKNHIFWSF